MEPATQAATMKSEFDPLMPKIDPDGSASKAKSEKSSAVKSAKPESPGAATEPSYFEDWERSGFFQEPLAFADGFDHSALEFRFFRADEMVKLTGKVLAGYWQPVHRDAVVSEIELSKVFAPVGDPSCPFDERGYYPRGNFVPNPRGAGECRESYLAVRSMAAKVPEQQLRAKLSAMSGASGTNNDVGAIAGSMNITNQQTGQPLLTTVPIRADGSRAPVNAVTSAGWGKQAIPKPI